MIPYGRQSIDEADIAAVEAVLRSDFLTQGPAVPKFEQVVAERCGAVHAVAVNSATSALHVACLALDLRPGDRLWTSPNSFVASANCGLYCGASVDFVDIDPRTYNLSAAALEAKLAVAAREGKLPKIVVPVHFAGQSCDMQAIHALGRRYGFRIVEDASHAIGGSYQGAPVGDCRYSDIAVLSFHPVKIVTSGEGGMALTKDPELAQRMRLLRSHGTTRDEDEMTQSPDGSWSYQQIMLGYNYRMTDIHAALGTSQMRRLGKFVARRRELVARYDEKLRNLEVLTPYCAPYGEPSWHLYVVQVKARGKRSRGPVFDALREAGTGVNVHYIPVHLQPYFRSLGFEPGDFPEAEKYYASCLTLPLFPTMTEAQQDQVIAAVTLALTGDAGR